MWAEVSMDHAFCSATRPVFHFHS